MIKNILRMAFVSSAIMLATSCQTYQPLVLQPETLYDEVSTSRSRSVTDRERLSFAEAATVMERNNTTLASLKMAYEGQQRVAQIKTPLPNPSLAFGPSIGTNLEGGVSSAVQPFVGLGFSIPLGPRLIRTDELNEILAIQAYNQTVVKHRSLYFELRQAFAQYSASTRVLDAHQVVAESFAETRRSTTRLVELGSISALGVMEADLQAAEMRVERLGLQAESESAAATLGRLMAVDSAQIRTLKPEALPKHPPIPELAVLKQLLLANNAALSEIEIELKVYDAELRLELARQYPDLSIGLDVDDEVGESKRTFSVGLGLDIPVFDRNRQAIAKAENERALRLVLYKGELSEMLSSVEEEYAKLQLIAQKLEVYRTEILPAARKNVEAGERAMKFGAIDVLRYLDFVSQLRQVEIKQVELEGERWSGIVSLEQLVGLPLVNLMADELSPLKDSLKLLELE